MKLAILFLVLLIFASVGFGKNVVIFEFYNKDGNNIPTASVGVLKSILQFAKFFPSAKVSGSSFDVKGRDIKEVIKAVPGYDDYIVGYYSFKNDVYSYNVTIYDQRGQVLESFSTSSRDLFEIADFLMNRIFSFYSGKKTSFATLEIELMMLTNKRYTIILNNEILASSIPNTNMSVRVVSKVPYSVVVRDDDTKGLVYDNTVILLDNEISKLKIEPKKLDMGGGVTQDFRTDDTVDKVIAEIDKIIRYRLFFNDKVLEDVKPKVDIVPVNVRKIIYNKYRVGLGITLVSCGLNAIIPGVGSLLIGDTGGVVVALLTPYISLVIASAAERDSLVERIFGIMTVIGYGYNLVRPLIYQYHWNTRLESFLKPNYSSYIQIEHNKVSLNVRF